MKKNPIICLRTLFCLLLLFVSSFPNLLFAQLAGNYTINPNLPASATNYLTFTSAVSDLVSGTRSDGGSKNGPGVKAAVVFNVSDDEYWESIKINDIIGTSSLNKVTFQSDPNNPGRPKLNLNYSATDYVSIIEFVRAKHITIRGMHFWGEAGTGSIINISDSSSNIEVSDNILISGSNNPNFAVPNLVGISVNSTAGMNGGSLPMYISKNLIRNNRIEGCIAGISMSAGRGDIIENNKIFNCVLAIGSSSASNITIQNNYISRVANQSNQRDFTGIFLGNTEGSCKVVKNIISSEISTGVWGHHNGLILIESGNSLEPKKFIIANNMISFKDKIVCTGIFAINFAGSIYSNSILINSDDDSSKAVMVLKGETASINFVNNNLYILKKGIALLVNKKSGWPFRESNNNNLFAPNGTLVRIDDSYGVLRFNNLHAFRQYTKTDSNSISVNPAYVSATDLHVRNPALDGKGKPLAEIKDDFDGEPRDPNFPDIGADEFTPVFSATDSVWPGDANYDRVANAWDVLNIGVAYNAAGTSRSNASSNWTAQAATDWSKAFSNGLNYKHADCNGDGKVDTSDLKPILLNYGKTHNKTSLNKTGTPNDPALYVQFPKDSFLAGDTVVADLYLGTNAISISNGYGFAFSLNYNPKYVDSGSFTIDLSNSWFGKKDTDLIYLVKDHYINGQVDIGITRINQKNVSGFGKIGTCSFVLQENIAGKRWIDRTITLEPSDVKMISADETEIPIYTIADSVKAHQFVGINEVKNTADKAIRIYPNPVKDMLTIDAAGQTVKEIKILNMLGQVVYEKQVQDAQEKIIVSTVMLPKGIYNFFITSAKGTSASRMVKY